MAKQSEKKTEKYLNEQVKALGGWSIKLLSTLIRGLPDRLVLYKGKAYFVEVKSEGEEPTIIQRLVHKKLAGLGFTVWVIDTKEQVNEFIKEIEI